MHHGYYGPTGGERKDHRQAQIDMIDETLAWAGVDSGAPPTRVLDVGCGIGGSSRHIARKYGSSGDGITLSPVQVERANALSAAQGLGVWGVSAFLGTTAGPLIAAPLLAYFGWTSRCAAAPPPVAHQRALCRARRRRALSLFAAARVCPPL